MHRLRGQVSSQDNQRGDKKHHQDAAVVLEVPFDLGLYTPGYTQPDSSAKNFHDGDAAWTRFLAARPLLYLPDRSPLTEEDPINRHRRLWTHEELQAFGDVVEQRTHVQLLAQERILHRWHQYATHIQRCFRGMRDRLNVLRLQREWGEYAATFKCVMELARERRRQHKAAIAIQRGYRRHCKRIIRQQRAAAMLQAASKRFMHRLRRWKARLTMQRAARCFLWRLRWQRLIQRVRKMMTAAARQQQLILTTEAFRRVREYALLQRQADTWVSHPERMRILLRTRRRKQKLQVSATLGILPPLQGTATYNVATKSSNKSVRPFTPQQQVLPSIQSSSRGR